MSNSDHHPPFSGNHTANISTATTSTKHNNNNNNNNNNNKNKNKPSCTTNLHATISTATSSAHSFLLQNDLLLLPSQSLLLESLLSSLLPKPPPQPHQPCWFLRFLSSSATWTDSFHMSKQSFDQLLHILSPTLSSSLPCVPPHFALVAAIFRLAHGASYGAVGSRFGMESSVACRAFFVVCKGVNDKLGYGFGEMRGGLKRVCGGRFFGFENCFGVLGLARFGIGGDILGKDGFLMLQALVDCEGRFMDVSAGWPRTMKVESVLHQSKLYLEVEESKEFLQEPLVKLKDGCLIKPYVLGDTCFPLLPWLLTPYRKRNEEDSFSSEERAFNEAHSEAMGLVGSAFGRLRARWRLLAKQWKEECVEYLPFVIVTGCLLHNFVIKCGESVGEEFDEHVKEEGFPVFEGAVDENAQWIRDALALHMSQVNIER